MSAPQKCLLRPERRVKSRAMAAHQQVPVPPPAVSQTEPSSLSQLVFHNEIQALNPSVPVIQPVIAGPDQPPIENRAPSSPSSLQNPALEQTGQPTTPTEKPSIWSRLVPRSKSGTTDDRYDHFITENRSLDCHTDQSAFGY